VSSGRLTKSGFTTYVRSGDAPCVGRCRSVAAAVLAAGEPGHRGVSVSARVTILPPPCVGLLDGNDPASPAVEQLLIARCHACERQNVLWEAVLAGLTGQGVESWLAMKKNKPKQQGIRGYGEDFDADVAVDMRLADYVLEGPAAIGLKRTDPEAGIPQRMYTSDPDSSYESASGAEEHEEAAAATASPTTHSM